MTSSFSIEAKGLPELDQLLEKVPRVTVKAATLALNDGARKARVLGAREIRKQVNLTASYVNERLTVTQKATETNLYSVISGRVRATSLMRFKARRLRKGVRVSVKPGSSRTLRRGFFIKLRAGGAETLGGNVGVAIRLKKGESFNSRRKGITRKRYSKSSNTDLALLYGPSVDQVFRTVRDDILSDVNNFIETEFHRQFSRLI